MSKRFLVYDKACRQPIGYVEAGDPRKAAEVLRRYIADPRGNPHDHLFSGMTHIRLDPLPGDADVTAYRAEWTFEVHLPSGGTETRTESHTWNLARLGD